MIDQYLLETLDNEQKARAQTLLESTREQKLNVEFTRELIGLVRGSSRLEHNNVSAGLTVDSSRLKNGANGESRLALTQHGPIYAKLMNQVPTANWIRFSLVLLLLTTTGWIVYLYSKERSLDAIRIAAERSNNEAIARLGQEREKSQTLNKELESEREQRRNAEEALAQSRPNQPPSLPTVRLAPATFVRDGYSKVLDLNLKTDRFRLQLEVKDELRHDQYSVSITTFDGRQIWSSDSFKPSQIKQGMLSMVLPGSLFEYDDYKIELKGREENGNFVHIADYAFKVRK
ncbi:MAG TPA: hypothetical protein VFS76_11070 [Pyrinomonadaceae bacterium]|nr:hypothetical protein [Pyrinomonadaceae bacterium]